MNKTFALALILFATSAQAQEPKAVVVLSVSFGVHSGEHRVSSKAEACSYGVFAPGTWSTQLSDPNYEQRKKLNSIQLIVPDSKKAANGTGEFLLAVGFGAPGNRSGLYTVDTRQPAAKIGGGTVTVDDRGKTASLKFTGITAEGVKIDGTVECNSVTRSGS